MCNITPWDKIAAFSPLCTHLSNIFRIKAVLQSDPRKTNQDNKHRKASRPLKVNEEGV